MLDIGLKAEYPVSSSSRCVTSFNPCYVGYRSERKGIGTQAVDAILFQSLLCWI